MINIYNLISMSYVIIKMSCIFLLFSFAHAYEDIYADIVNEVREDLALLKNEQFICISLGNNCPSAQLLDSLGVRHRSYPFDWNYTPFKALYAVIKDDFKDFINPEVLLINNQPDGVVVNKKYECQFHHMFNSNKWMNTEKGLSLRDPKDTTEPLDAFLRRIIRFQEVLKLGVPIYFFRLDYINPPEAITLKDLLHSKFPYTKFTLVCLHEYENPRDWHGEFWSEGDWDNLEDIVHLVLYPCNPHQDSDDSPPFAHILSSIELLNKSK